MATEITMLPSGNQAWQWTIHPLSLIFPSKPSLYLIFSCNVLLTAGITNEKMILSNQAM
jgi:hypothetical protein